MTNNGRVDESLMQPAIVTGTQGFQIFLNGFDDGTTEVKNLLNYECDVIIECRYKILILSSCLEFGTKVC